MCVCEFDLYIQDFISYKNYIIKKLCTYVNMHIHIVEF